MLQKLLLKEQFKRTAEATGDLIRNKIADKITLSGKSKEEEKTKEAEEINIPPENSPDNEYSRFETKKMVCY